MSTVSYKTGDNDVRPWGCWTVLATGDGFVIKQICVNPNGKLSLQSHKHRRELWLILKGTATITLGDKVFSANPNDTIDIAAGELHRIVNQTDSPVCFIEIQQGNILDETDITRYADEYGRQ